MLRLIFGPTSTIADILNAGLSLYLKWFVVIVHCIFFGVNERKGGKMLTNCSQFYMTQYMLQLQASRFRLIWKVLNLLIGSSNAIKCNNN